MSAAQRWKAKLADIALREGKGVTVQVPLDELRELVREADALASAREATDAAVHDARAHFFELERVRELLREFIARAVELSGAGDEGGACYCDALDYAEPLEHAQCCVAMRELVRRARKAVAP